MAPAGRWPGRRPAAVATREIRFHDITPIRAGRCPDRLDLTIPAGTSLAIVGQNGAKEDVGEAVVHL
jgi:hypothetical protein